MPFCRNCGSEVGQYDRFCLKCGHPQPQTVTVYPSRPKPMPPQQKKKSKCLLVAGILATIYLIFSIAALFDLSIAGNTKVITPHAAMIAVAVVFNWISFIDDKVWAARTAGILYFLSWPTLTAIHGVASVNALPLILPLVILCLVGCDRLRKNNLIDNQGKTS